MNREKENLLYLKIGSSFDALRLAKETFEDYLLPGTPASSPNYYKARNYLRDAERFHQEAFTEAKKLLGPAPVYASADFEKWRQEFLSQHHVLVTSEKRESIKEELQADEQLGQWLSPRDIERLLNKNFEPQRSGKRRLANIKVRIVLDRLNELLTETRQLRKRAMEKFQGSG